MAENCRETHSVLLKTTLSVEVQTPLAKTFSVSINMHSAWMVINGMMLFKLINVSISTYGPNKNMYSFFLNMYYLAFALICFDIMLF